MDADTITKAMDGSKTTDEEAATATIEELPASTKVAEPDQDIPTVPALFTSPPPIRDDLITISSEDQDETVDRCLPYLAGIADPNKTLFDFTPRGVARLERDDHVVFLTDALQNATYMAYDAARPWCVYWALTGLTLLGVDVGKYHQR